MNLVRRSTGGFVACLLLSAPLLGQRATGPAEVVAVEAVPGIGLSAGLGRVSLQHGQVVLPLDAQACLGRAASALSQSGFVSTELGVDAVSVGGEPSAAIRCHGLSTSQSLATVMVAGANAGPVRTMLSSLLNQMRLGVLGDTSRPPPFGPSVVQQDARRYTAIPRSAIPGYNIQTLNGVTVADCESACDQRNDCLTFDYTRGGSTCYLQNTGEGVVSSNSYDHYAKPSTRGPLSLGAASSGPISSNTGGGQRDDDPEARGIRWSDSLYGLGLNDNNGKRYTFRCPAAPSRLPVIYGAGTYTSDSSVCSAAVHSGVITRAGGTVPVAVGPGQDSYRASMQNGITSYVYGGYERGSLVIIGSGGAGTTALKPPPGGGAAGVRGLSGAPQSCSTSEGAMTFTGATKGRIAKFGNGQDRIIGTLAGGSIDGYWVETKSKQRCSSVVDGSYYWGRFVARFTGSHFDGKWSYCDAALTGSWTGDCTMSRQGGPEPPR